MRDKVWKIAFLGLKFLETMSYSLFVIVCLAIHAVINLDIFRKKPTVNLPAIGAYRVFVISIAAYFLIDMLWGIFEENKNGLALYIDTTIYFIAMGFSILAWTRYIVKFLDDKSWVGKALLYFGNAFFLAELALLVINIFHPILFTVDFETAVYTAYKARNIMLYVQILMYFLLLVYTLIHAIRKRGTFGRKYFTVGLYSIIMGTTITIQIYYPYLPLYSIGCIVGIAALNAFVINDIKEEYKAALAKSQIEVEHRKEELSETKHIAYSDPLTGIKNKHAYVEEEERIDRLIGKNEMEDFAVIVFDLNGLKRINDTKGHDAGDAYIVQAVKTIQRFFGKEHLYRFGGDEFVIILEGDSLKERQKALIEFEYFIDDCLENESKPIISSGMSKYRKGQDNTYHAVFNRADKIMYARKDSLKEHHI